MLSLSHGYHASRHQSDVDCAGWLDIPEVQKRLSRQNVTNLCREETCANHKPRASISKSALTLSLPQTDGQFPPLKEEIRDCVLLCLVAATLGLSKQIRIPSLTCT